MGEFYFNKYSNLLFCFILDNQLTRTNCMKICPTFKTICYKANPDEVSLITSSPTSNWA